MPEWMKPVRPAILVVDDLAENLLVMQRTLAKLPVEVDCVRSGDEALKKLIKKEYAVAILDVQMPGMSGFELAELLTGNTATQYLPIIFVTAMDKEQQHIYEGYQAGGVDYLFKPFNTDVLLAKIRVFLRLAESRAALQRSQKQLSSLLTEVNDGWWEWQLSSQQFFFSTGFKKNLGYQEGELDNTLRSWQKILPEDHRDLIETLTTPPFPTETAHQSVFPCIHKSGQVKWLLCRSLALEGTGGQLERLVGVITDITPLKKLELSLKKSNEELKQFAYIASHDLRAPLRGIENIVSWIEEDCGAQLSGKSREHFTKLKNRVCRMDDLINGILLYSRTGHSQPPFEQTDLNELVKACIELLGVPEQVTIEIETPLPTLRIPALQFNQIFSNLISNAIKYNDKPEIEIQIGVSKQLEGYRFYVKDNGPGIALSLQEKAFQLFQTLQPRDKVESTGVGLTIVKKIVELYGGRVWFESENNGQGTTFYFTWLENGGEGDDARGIENSIGGG